MGVVINKNIKVPLHYQIYLDILRKIQDGILIPGEKLPSEPELERIYDVSRVTIRSAIEMLSQEGLVKKNRGKQGTVVCEAKHSYDIKKLTSFTDDVHQYGENARSKLLSFKLMEPGHKISSLLHLEQGQQVYFIERIRYRQGDMVGLHRSYIKRENNLTLKEEDFTPDASLYAMLKKGGIQPTTATEILEVKIPDKQVADILQLEPKVAVFYKERVTYSEGRRPFEFVEMYYIAEYYQYKIELKL